MTSIRYFHVDAFTQRVHAGNPAGVCLLDQWIPDASLQSIAAENHLPETAFLVRESTGYHLRWFTPVTEVDLCGHATLASAHIVFSVLQPKLTEATFATKSGPLTVRRSGDLMVMDFPAMPAATAPAPEPLLRGLRHAPREVLKARDYLCIYDDETAVRNLQPDLGSLAQLADTLGVIVSAPGTDVDFVSRFFAPRAGIPEDPVTGSAHCTLVPYWSRKLGKRELLARQVSPRTGDLFCTDRGERVLLAGYAVTYLIGELRASSSFSP